MRRHILGEQLVDNEKEEVSKVLPKIEEVEMSDSKCNNSMLDLNLTRAFDSKDRASILNTPNLQMYSTGFSFHKGGKRSKSGILDFSP